MPAKTLARPFIVIAAATLTMCAVTLAAQAQTAPHVSVVSSKIIDMVARVSVSGTLVARNEVFVNTRVNGQIIEQLNADIGDTVKKGEVLAVLDTRTLSVRLEQAVAELTRAQASVKQVKSQIDLAQVSLDQARTSFERNASLRRSGTISQAVLDQSTTGLNTSRASAASAEDGLTVADAQVKQAEIQVKLAKLNLSFTEIRSPVDGLISSRSAKLGAAANAGAGPMFRLIDKGEIEVAVDVIETEIGSLSIGDKALLDIAGLKKISGQVRQISPRIDRRTRLGAVRISLAPNKALRIGLFANGWIVTERRQAPAIPASAVLSDNEGDFVLAVVNNVVRKRHVTTGLFWNGYREILDGLDSGQPVMLRAGAFFRDGDSVTPVPDPTGLTAEAGQ